MEKNTGISLTRISWSIHEAKNMHKELYPAYLRYLLISYSNNIVLILIPPLQMKTYHEVHWNNSMRYSEK